MELGSFDGGEDGEYSGVGFVEISELFATQDEFFYIAASAGEVKS